jgi:pimeloyl-ACP methyl ester carboxylesterase
MKELVCLHAAGSGAGTWDGVRPRLEVLGYRVHCLTLAGHGAAERRTAYRLQDFRDDVLKELDELRLSEVTLVGHSLGAFVATQVAMEGRVERLVLEELPVPRRDAADGSPSGKAGTGIALKVMGTLGRKVLREVVAELRKPQPLWWAGLASIKVPTLILAGGSRSHLDQTRYDAVAEQMPEATIVTVEAGHRIHTHAPDQWLSAVKRFLAAN